MEIKQADFDDRVMYSLSNPDIFSTSQRIIMAQEMMQVGSIQPADSWSKWYV